MIERETTDTIVIHCADTPDNRDVDMATIKKWHVEGRGWSDIGDHVVIRRNGLVEDGMHNKVNIEFIQKQLEKALEDIEMLKEKARDQHYKNGNYQ